MLQSLFNFQQKTKQEFEGKQEFEDWNKIVHAIYETILNGQTVAFFENTNNI
jgi:hypothetical protein